MPPSMLSKNCWVAKRPDVSDAETGWMRRRRRSAGESDSTCVAKPLTSLPRGCDAQPVESRVCTFDKSRRTEGVE